MKILIGMVQPNTQRRFTTVDVNNSTYFATGMQSVLNSIDSLPTRDIGTQSSHLISLLNQVRSGHSTVVAYLNISLSVCALLMIVKLDEVPVRVLTLAAIPVVNKVCLANGALWVYGLPLHASVFCLRLPKETYQEIAGAALAIGLNSDTGLYFLSFFSGSSFR